MLRYVAVLVLILAVLGAVLHPIVFLIGFLPFDTNALQSVLDAAKTFVADFLAWGLVSLLLMMGMFVIAGRWQRRLAAPRDVHRPDNSTVGHDRIAVAIIAYNEAGAIGHVVEDFNQQEGVVATLVIDNNSGDETAALARAAGATVISEMRQGYGFACIRALAEGLAVSSADVVVLVEGDGTFVGSDLMKFRSYIGQADMVVGTRVVPGMVESGSQMDYFFTWGNIAVGTLLRLRFWDSQFLGAARLSDVGCTFRAIRREALERILPDLAVGGHHFSPHMMVVALHSRLRLIEIPVTFRRRIGASKGASQSARKGFQVGLQMIWHILTYRPGLRSTRVSAADLLAVDGDRAREVSRARL
jgi:hypothetical protein